MPNVQEFWEKTQVERAELEVYPRRNGETLQSIQRHIPEAPPPISVEPTMPPAPPPLRPSR